jgi:hypothetical protein
LSQRIRFENGTMSSEQQQDIPRVMEIAKRFGLEFLPPPGACERNELGKSQLHYGNPNGIASSSPRLPSLRGYLGLRFGNEFNRNAVVAFPRRQPFNPKHISHPIRSRVVSTTHATPPEN